MISRLFPSVNPMPQAAQPEYEFSIEMTTGMSAPPIGTISRNPNSSDSSTRRMNATGDSPMTKITISTINSKASAALSGC